MQNWRIFCIHSEYLCFLLILQEWECVQSAINVNKSARSNTQKGISEKVSTCVFFFNFFLLNSNIRSMCLFMCNIYCYTRCLFSFSILICFSSNQQFLVSLWFLCIILNFIKSYFFGFYEFFVYLALFVLFSRISLLKWWCCGLFCISPPYLITISYNKPHLNHQIYIILYDSQNIVFAYIRF